MKLGVEVLFEQRRDLLQRGGGFEAIAGRFQREAARFAADRERFLLYP